MEKMESSAPGDRVRRRPSLPPSTRKTRAFPQQRARDTHLALMSAAAEVFAERGYDAAQTPEISRRAGVSVGTFYRYYADKRQAFLEMIRQYLEEAFETVMSRLDPDALSATRSEADRRNTVDHVIDVLFRHAAKEPRLHRVFIAMSLRDPDVAALRAEFDERGRIALGALLEQVAPRERVPDALAAAEVIQIAAREVAITTAGAHAAPYPPERAVALRNALADMIYRYVWGAGG